MSDTPRITYVPLPDATLENELDTLAAVYKFILDRYAQKKAAEGSGGEDDAKKGFNDVRAKTILPR